MAADLLPAAQYLRMSTEHQQYSLQNQSAAIRKYADSHGCEIVQTYSDAAKSGVALKRRTGLRQLLQDVVSGNAPYRAILVYDVSRWGRFQDTDESAHYEFVCKSAGVPVHYCAETFANDGSLPSMIMKALKRTMAGEYSRELGVKVLAGQKRLAPVLAMHSKSFSLSSPNPLPWMKWRPGASCNKKEEDWAVNGRTLSPFPTETGQMRRAIPLFSV
jgi:hypothetical protein